MELRPAFLDTLESDEGCPVDTAGHPVAYPDPLSPLALECRRRKIKPQDFRKVPNWHALSGAPWTIGFGHTGPDVTPDTAWTMEKARARLAQDAASHAQTLVDALPWVTKLDPVRQDVLFNMVFNMGWDNPRTPEHEGLSGFTVTLGMIQAGRYDAAAIGMLNSRWAQQVKGRATRLAREMRTGKAA